jgi:internalin A
MKKLWYLHAQANRIANLSPLAGLTNLRELQLDGNQITDLSSLAGLKQLTTLGLTQNPKLTRAEIDKLKKALPNCVIHHDLMSGAEKIEADIRGKLRKPGGEITQADLAKLKELGGYRGVSDISPMKGAINVERIELRHNQISDLSALADMKKLRYLNALENRITDLSPLAGLSNLRELHLGKNQLTDLSPLAGLKQLTTLSLSDNPKLTRAEIDKLQKALPKCKITHNAKE